MKEKENKYQILLSDYNLLKEQLTLRKDINFPKKERVDEISKIFLSLGEENNDLKIRIKRFESYFDEYGKSFKRTKDNFMQAIQRGYELEKKNYK